MGGSVRINVPPTIALGTVALESRLDRLVQSIRRYRPEDREARKVDGAPCHLGVGPGRAGVFDQIVQRAIVQVKTGQSEIKIDLKPDFLGNVRMHIVSENQQVSVRILTELPAVGDMIETGLQQLRSDLQNQGLHVDRLEVAVSDDPRQPPRRQARPGELQEPGGIGAASSRRGRLRMSAPSPFTTSAAPAARPPSICLSEEFIPGRGPGMNSNSRGEVTYGS